MTDRQFTTSGLYLIKIRNSTSSPILVEYHAKQSTNWDPLGQRESIGFFGTQRVTEPEEIQRIKDNCTVVAGPMCIKGLDRSYAYALVEGDG